MTGVTGKNYGDKGSAFIMANPDRCFTIKRQSYEKRDESGHFVKPTAEDILKWGAWRAYFIRIGYSVHRFDKCDYYTVPASWPHEFDAEATVAADYVAGEQFVEFLRMRKDEESDHRMSPVAMKKMVSDFKSRAPVEKPQAAPRAPLIDTKLLFESWELDNQELMRKREKRGGAAKAT